MRMKLFIQYFGLSLLVMGCATTKKDARHSSHYFEGKITFRIDYEAKHPNITKEGLEANLGATMVYYVKEGNTLKEYYNQEGDMVQQRLFLLKDHISYALRSDSDTILYYDPIETDHITKVMKMEVKKEILGYECVKIYTEAVPIPGKEHLPDIKTTYYCAPQLSHNPEWFAKMNDGNFKEVMAKGKGYYLGVDQSGVYWNNTMRAIEVKEEKLSWDIFAIDLNGPKKKI